MCYVFYVDAVSRYSSYMSIHSNALEAVLFTAGKPMEKKHLMILLDISHSDLADALTVLRTELDDRGLTVVETPQEVELRTASTVAQYVKKFLEGEFSRDLGKAGLEVLSIILYRGSATRGEIDWVRGVQSSATVRSLLLRGLIKGDEDAQDHRKVRYSATIDALGHLGISCIEDLPSYEKFSRVLKETQHESIVSVGA